MNRKKYYIVTGEAYKCMLMASRAKKGRDTRKYYLKVERLAMTMKDYIVEKSKKESKKENQYLQNTIRCLENNMILI